MKKKVRKALTELRGVLDRNGGIDAYGTIDLASLEVLVKWAEKKAKRPKTLEVGDAVRLTEDIELSSGIIPKGATGTVGGIDVYDPFDVYVILDVPCPYMTLGFMFSELEKVGS